MGDYVFQKDSKRLAASEYRQRRAGPIQFYKHEAGTGRDQSAIADTRPERSLSAPPGCRCAAGGSAARDVYAASRRHADRRLRQYDELLKREESGPRRAG